MPVSELIFSASGENLLEYANLITGALPVKQISMVTQALVLDERDSDIVQKLLSRKYIVEHVLEQQAAIEFFKSNDIGVVFVNVSLDGLHVLEVLSGMDDEVPIVVLSDEGNIEEVVCALRVGAWDYLSVPVADDGILDHILTTVFKRASLEKEHKKFKSDLDTANIELEKNLALLMYDQKAGREAQAHLLPPDNATLEDYTFSQRMYSSQHLSGDFLDYFELDERYLGFYIADVSGQGSSSAFVTIILKSLMNSPIRKYRTHYDTTVLKPDKLLKVLNDEILDSRLGKYLTMFYGVIDKKHNSLTYSIGGHYPKPVLMNGAKQVILEGDGFPVGLFKWANFSARSVELNEQCSLAMFSDGVFDCIVGQNLEDKEKSLAQFCTQEHMSINRIINFLKLDKKTLLADDVTLFLIQRNINHGI